MTEDKVYVCDECGEEFPSPIKKAQHMKAEHSKAKVGGASKVSFLSEEDISELKEREKRVRELELQLKEAKLNAELRKLQTTDQPVKEKTWVLPDGTSFQGTSADYRDMLQTYYQVQAINKKATTETENPSTIKAMLERMAELEKQVSESKMKSIEDKLNYIASRDPLESAEDALARFNKLAQSQGLTKAGSSIADEIRLKHADIQGKALESGIEAINKKLDRTFARTEKIENEIVPVTKKFVETFLDDYRMKHGMIVGEPVPHSEAELEVIAKNLEKSEIQQEVAEKQEPKQTASPPEPKPTSPPFQMKEFTPRPDLHGHES